MAGQITLTMSLVFIALFSVAIFGFAIGFANDTDAVMSISDDAEISEFYSKTRTNLSSFKTQSKEGYESILKSNVPEGSDVVQSVGPFEVTVKNLIGVGINIIKLPYQKIFGSGGGFGIFFTIFSAVIAFLFILFLYKTLRGNP